MAALNQMAVAGMQPVAGSDDDLVRRSALSDPQAFRELYRRHVTRVRSMLMRLVGPSQLDDLTQEVFLKFWTALKELRQPEYLSTWLYRVTFNVATDALRRRQSLGRWQENDDAAVAAASAPVHDAGDALHAQRVVARALAALDFDHRATLVLFDVEGLPQQEIAEVLGISVGTVKSRIFNARKKVRDVLAREGIEP